MESGCETDGTSGTNWKKYPVFKSHKDKANFKWKLGTYFTTNYDFKKAITNYVFQFGMILKFIKMKNKGLGLYVNMVLSVNLIVPSFQRRTLETEESI